MGIKRAFLALAASDALAGSALVQPCGGGSGLMCTDGGGHCGSHGMRPGMMGGLGNQAHAGLKLSAEEKKRITAIQQDTQKAMFETQLAAHRKIDALLTKEQLEHLRR